MEYIVKSYDKLIEAGFIQNKQLDLFYEKQINYYFDLVALRNIKRTFYISFRIIHNASSLEMARERVSELALALNEVEKVIEKLKESGAIIEYE